MVAQSNATPVFVDICPLTYNLDLKSLAQAIETLDRQKLTPKGIIAVDLFGQPADYAGIKEIANNQFFFPPNFDYRIFAIL